jgi:hypothetical protein
VTTRALVGPVPTVRFHDGTVVAYSPPRSTVDGNRWRSCTDHRVACDCREAELAEQISELRSELKAVADVARRVLAGHATYAWEDGPNGERAVGCMCTGCQIVRDTYVLLSHEMGPNARDEVDGLDAEQVAAGLRWKVCTSYVRGQARGICTSARTRWRGVFHEHLLYADGTPVTPEWTEAPF